MVHRSRKVSSVPAGLVSAAGNVHLGFSAHTADQVLTALIQTASAVHHVLCIIQEKQDLMWPHLAQVKIVLPVTPER